MAMLSAQRKALPAVAVGVVAAAAWVPLMAGTVGHPSHDHLLGGDHGVATGELAGFYVGWLLMVLSMMLPAEIPQLAARQPGVQWGTVAALVAATCAVWTAFAAVALLGDAVLHGLVESWSWLGSHQTLIPAAVFVTAGLFQVSGFGRRLHHAARAPEPSAARHAVACLGSCGPVMLVMFAVGTGSLLWMVVLTTALVLERTSRLGPRLVPLTGLALVAAGLLAA